MNKSKALILSLMMSYWVTDILSAQENIPQAHWCGISHEDETALYEQMISNRTTISAEEIAFQRNKRDYTYIPVTVHFITDYQGNNAADPVTAVNTLCNLNNRYAPLGIQFYFSDTLPIRYYSNQILYEDALAFYYSVYYRLQKVHSDINIFIGRNNSRNVAGFYDNNADILYIEDRNATIDGMAAPHELGHFFTLPHTFYGWESYHYERYVGNGPTPTTLGSVRVENVPRTGPYANCYTAGDGFCDTPADYYAFRLHCNYPFTAVDPQGLPLQPDASNYMSYFSDSCVSHFSNEQSNAIWASILRRGWSNRPAPNSASINRQNIDNNIYPNTGTQLDLNFYQNQVRFTWSKQNGAIGYLFYLEQYNVQGGMDTLQALYLPQNNQQALLQTYTARISRTGHYRWKVQAIGQYICEALNTDFYNFTVSMDGQSIAVEEMPYPLSQKKIDLHIYGNPIQSGRDILTNISVWEDTPAQVQLYSLDGRLLNKQNIHLNAGQDNFLNIATNNLSAGCYLLCVQSNLGQIQSKILLY